MLNCDPSLIRALPFYAFWLDTDMTDQAASKSEAAANDKKTAANLDPAHVMDFSNLHLGHPPSSKTIVTIVDLDVYVYGLEEIKESKRPISVAVRLTRGRREKAG